MIGLCSNVSLRPTAGKCLISAIYTSEHQLIGNSNLLIYVLKFFPTIQLCTNSSPHHKNVACINGIGSPRGGVSLTRWNGQGFRCQVLTNLLASVSCSIDITYRWYISLLSCSSSSMWRLPRALMLPLPLTGPQRTPLSALSFCSMYAIVLSEGMWPFTQNKTERPALFSG